jgi:hypothetical protein
MPAQKAIASPVAFAGTTLLSTWTELFDLGFGGTPPTKGRSPLSHNYMLNLIVSTYLYVANEKVKRQMTPNFRQNSRR